MGSTWIPCKGVIQQPLGGMERDNSRFHHATQKGTQVKHELFISGIDIFELWLGVCVKPLASETAGKREPPCASAGASLQQAPAPLPGLPVDTDLPRVPEQEQN